MVYEDFFSSLKEATNKFRELDVDVVRIVSHLDSDGLTSAAILISALRKENKNFVLSIAKQITSELLDELALENYKVIFFTDLGSGSVKEISEKLNDKFVFILDHHQTKKQKFNGLHINPVLYDVDGNKEISGSGVTYLFCRELNNENKENSHLAIIGAIGDNQEDYGFVGLNKEILEDAQNKIEIKNSLRMFGAQTRAINKVLEYSTDPYIPGITGNEGGSISLLQELEIKIKENGVFRRLIDLGKEEMERLVTAIVIKRRNEEVPEKIIGPIYLLKNEEDSLKDLREFSTLLNACGRLRKPSLAIGACLDNKELKKEALELLIKYKLENVKSLNWFYEKRDSKSVIEDKGFVIVNAEDFVRDTMIGTIMSILSKSGLYENGTILIGLAHTFDGYTKVSSRLCGYKKDINIKELLEKMSKKFECEIGGHDLAAGLLLPQEKELEFIEEAKNYLKKFVMEDIVK